MERIVLVNEAIFITGVAGFIGSNLVKRLFKDVKGATIIGIDNLSDYYDVRLKEYAATKKSNELFAHCYSKLYDIPTTGLRFFTVYGPAGRPDMAYFGFTRPVNYGRWRNVRSVTKCYFQ